MMLKLFVFAGTVSPSLCFLSRCSLLYILSSASCISLFLICSGVFPPSLVLLSALVFVLSLSAVCPLRDSWTSGCLDSPVF